MYMTVKIAMSRQWSTWFHDRQQTIASASGGTTVITPVIARSTFTSTGARISSGVGPSSRGSASARPEPGGAVSGRVASAGRGGAATGPVETRICTDADAAHAEGHCGDPPKQGGPPPKPTGG